MDGRVLSKAFMEDFLKTNPIRYQKTAQEDQEIKPEELTAEEEKKLRERLKGLGYLG